MKNAFNNLRRFDRSMYEMTPESAFNFCPAFFYIS